MEDQRREIEKLKLEIQEKTMLIEALKKKLEESEEHLNEANKKLNALKGKSEGSQATPEVQEEKSKELELHKGEVGKVSDRGGFPSRNEHFKYGEFMGFCEIVFLIIFLHFRLLLPASSLKDYLILLR